MKPSWGPCLQIKTSSILPESVQLMENIKCIESPDLSIRNPGPIISGEPKASRVLLGYKRHACCFRQIHRWIINSWALHLTHSSFNSKFVATGLPEYSVWTALPNLNSVYKVGAPWLHDLHHWRHSRTPVISDPILTTSCIRSLKHSKWLNQWNTFGMSPRQSNFYIRWHTCNSLGNSGLKISKIILGTMGYGSKQWQDWVLDEEDALPLIEHAYKLGINTWDTVSQLALFLTSTHAEIIN